MSLNLSTTKDLRKIYSGSIIVFIGAIINSAAQYFLILVLGRGLGPADVGLFLLGRAILRFANTGSNFGLSGSLLKFIPEYLVLKQNNRIYQILKFALASSFSLSLFMAVVLYFSAPFLGVKLFRDENLIPVLRLFSIGLPIYAILTIILSAIRSFRDMTAFSIVDVIEPLGILVITLIVFIYVKNVQSVIIAYLLSIFISIIVGIIFLKKKLPKKEENGSGAINTSMIISYSLPFMGSDYMGLSLLWLDTFMIGIFMDAEAVGIYNGAIKIALFSKLILMSVNSIFGPTISKLYAKGDITGISSAYKATVRWIIHLSFPCFLFIFFFSKQIMGFYGPEFVQGATALIVLSAGQLVSLSVGSAGSLLNMTGRPKVELYNRGFALILNFLLNLYLIPLMGINGAAVATASSISLVNILRLVENYIFLNIHPFSLRILYPFIRERN